VLAPTRCYSAAMEVLAGHAGLHAAAHISGGGLQDNLVRVIPPGLSARVVRGRIPTPPVFAIIQSCGPVDPAEMWQVFNMGVGFVLIVASDAVDAILASVNEQSYAAQVIGDIAPSETEARFAWLD
jgi:phosphoribosylformylglycinamidine cyclo-ligase